ncbi:hypothetical protein [Undibacterium sp. Xuan67W]|uniref:hypothetical protein n=1 Tax=Undibacterium sp. Xuan67W TaxID=3413057 RepID=UPI003BF31D1D
MLDFGKNANFFFGYIMPLMMLRTVHSPFTLQANETLLAVMNLDANTRNETNTFLLISLGIYPKCRGVSIFIFRTQLASLTVVGDTTERRYCGVVLSNRHHFLCSCLRPANLLQVTALQNRKFCYASGFSLVGSLALDRWHLFFGVV